jgi:hypothetical protein
MTSDDLTKNELECVVCMEPCAELSIMCCNGHMVCEKHYLQRAKAIYEEGRSAFSNKENVQRCFLCRTDIPTYKFSDKHNKIMDVIIADGEIKKVEKETGAVFSTEERNNAYKHALQQIKELQISGH